MIAAAGNITWAARAGALRRPRLGRRPPITAAHGLRIHCREKMARDQARLRPGSSRQRPGDSTFLALRLSMRKDHIPRVDRRGQASSRIPSSYCFRSPGVAGRALMIRIRSLRSQCATNTSCSLIVWPIVISRCSSAEWSGSANVNASGSKNTDAASSNETPCFFRLAAAFRASHSKITPPLV